MMRQWLFLSLLWLFVVALPNHLHATEEPQELDRARIELESDIMPSSWWDRFRALPRLLQLRAGGRIRPQPGTTFRVTAVAYSPTVDQNDASPCITASGARVAPDVVATNFLPFGTRLKIDGKEYVVRDRMNAKYNGKYIIDIWHPTRAAALTFGAKTLTIEIVGYEEKELSRRTTSQEPSASPTTLALATPSPTPASWRERFGSFVQRYTSTRVLLQDYDCLTEK